MPQVNKRISPLVRTRRAVAGESVLVELLLQVARGQRQLAPVLDAEVGKIIKNVIYDHDL